MTMQVNIKFPLLIEIESSVCAILLFEFVFTARFAGDAEGAEINNFSIAVDLGVLRVSAVIKSEL